MFLCRDYQGKAQALDCGLFQKVRANHGSYIPKPLHGWVFDNL